LLHLHEFAALPREGFFMVKRSGPMFAAAVLASLASVRADVSWTAATNTSWATGSNWGNNTGPGATDVASFASPGSATAPGDVTSIVNVSRTIGGLYFNNTAGHYHTVDLNNDTLTIAGNLNVNVDQSSSTTTTLRDGSLVFSGAYANINVGRGVAASASGIADLTGLSSVSGVLQSIEVGASSSGSASGTLLLSPSNILTSQLIQVGAANSSSDTNGTLDLGLNNNISAGEFDIGKDNSNGMVNITNGGSLTLGSASQQTLLQIADQNTNTNNTYSGTMTLGSASVNLQLSSLIVAEKNGGPGYCNGTLIGGSSGSATIGTAATPGVWYAGYTANGGNTNGNVDFSGMGSLRAYVTNFWIGDAANGSATGNVALPQSSSINASIGVVVGSGAGGSGTLTLGKNTTLSTPQLTIGQNYTNGMVQIGSGGILNLGSAAVPTSVYIGNDVTNSNNTYTGELNLTGGTLNAYVNQVIVGLRDGAGGGGSAVGTWLGGAGGSITIGPANNTANFYVGRSITDSPATGTVDFSGLTSLTASVNTLALGTATDGGSAQGTLALAANNTINATNIIVGSSGNGNDVLTLGSSNTILTNQLIIAEDYSSGTVSLPAGGVLNLGSAAERANVFIANGTTNTNNTYTGILDASNGIINAYLGTVVLGTKNNQPGGEQATFSIGNSSANRVDATSITMGGTDSTGTLNFGGGVLYAGSIAAGVGTAVFNWYGGQLSVGSFGTSAIHFNLNNTGTGILAPGSAANAIGTTTVYGNFNQSASATTAMDLAGSSSSDQINITGTATLAGTLALNLQNGFTPAVGQNFLLETYASHTGAYGFVLPPALPSGVALKLDYSTSTQLVLSFVTPTPESYVSSAAFGTFSSASSWDAQTVPGTADAVSMVNSGVSSRAVSVPTSTTVDSALLQGNSATMQLNIPAGVEFAVEGQTTVATNGMVSIAAGGTVLSQGGISGGGSTVVAAGATLTAAFIRQGMLTLNGSATVAQSNPHDSAASVSVIAQLNLGGSINAWTGKLDLTNNDLDLANIPLATVWNQVSAGYAGGTWNGSGITSSAAGADTLHLTALGVISNSVNGTTPLYGSGTQLGTFDGTNPGAGDVLVKFTYVGDTNLDGKVDGSDYSRIDNGFLTQSTGWYNGDFNYDGVVNGSDYTLIDNAFNTQGASLSASIAGIDANVTVQIADPQSVPEPTPLGWIGIVSACLSRRRVRPCKPLL
jgi:hypothetical protein